MLVPLSWLKDYVDINISADELEKKLFDCGFEVEEKWQVGKDISGIVVGYVDSCEPIPETHLHVCQVNVGGPELLQICCGADNVKAGGKFPVAMIGAKVYATAKDHVTIEGVATIKKGKLRGYESQGMLCSGTELGLNEDLYPGAGYNGLLVLPEDAEIGSDVKELTGLNDWIFDVSITANRPDCQSIFGLAREVAAALGEPLKTPALDYTETEVEKEGFNVTVEAQDLCPRYIAHYVYDVKLGQSPAWMRRRLALVGNNSISNIVDITNYIMRELGQPLHAFDCDYLEGNAINVRRAAEGEKIVTLDEKEFASVFRDKFINTFAELKQKLDTSHEIAAVKNIRLESDTLKLRCMDEITEYEEAHHPKPVQPVPPETPPTGGGHTEPPKPVTPPVQPKPKKRKNVSISNVAGARTYSIENEQDIDKFLAEMKKKLLNELDENTIITLS